ncbi:MAG: imelysin family protein [Pseudomonadota bacterium]
MRAAKTLCLSLCLSFATSSANGFTVLGEEEAALLQTALTTSADAFVLPAYEAQQAAAADLNASLGAYCVGEGAIEPAQEAFVDLFVAWQRASIVGLGPIMDEEGPLRVQLWPDSKGHSQRATRTAIRAGDPALLEPGALVGRSIALTNLTALEGLLFRDLAAQSYACDLARAIAAFQADLATDLVAAWSPGSGYRAVFDSAGDGNETYPTVDALVREFLAGSIVYTDRLRKFKLARGLGDAPGDARPERTEAVRSGAGLASLEESFRTLAAFYDTPGGLFDAATAMGGTKNYSALADVATSVADSLAALDRSLEEVVAADGDAAADLRRYVQLVTFHEAYLKVGFLNSIGLSAGFTSADGD